MPATSTLSITQLYDATTTTATAGTVTEHVVDNLNPNWAPGTAAGQIDLVGSLTGTLSASTNTHTLSAFPSATGTLAFVKVRELWVHNTGSVVIKVTPGGSQPWVAGFASDVNVRPGGVFLLVAPDITGIPVVSGTTDKFTVVCTSASTYKLIIKGTSV